MTDIAALSGGSQSRALHVNGNGQVVGWAEVSPFVFHAFQFPYMMSDQTVPHQEN
jgi:probable HAF family extracellular repeat protein